MTEGMPQYTGETPEAAPAGSEAPSSDGQTPLLLQDMQLTEEGIKAGSSGGAARPAVVVGMIVVAAVGVLFAMRQFGLGPAVSLAEVAVEYKPEESASGLVSSKIMADLERSRRAVQVPAKHITQDPFHLDTGAEVADKTVIDADLAMRAEQERLRQAREDRQMAIQSALDDLALQSVMLGSRPVARISGQIYRVGMPVGEFFTVRSIEGREVTLVADGLPYVLTLETDRPSGPSRRRNR